MKTRTLALALIVLAGIVSFGIFQRQESTPAPKTIYSGGYQAGPMPPPLHIVRGTLPASYSLVRHILRTHNQGAGNSCVSQALSTMEEIWSHERGKQRWFSAGYIYNQTNGGGNNPTTYANAFAVLQYQGDAPFSAFPLDGYDDILSQPGSSARAAAYPYRIAWWRTISPWDSGTMEAEIRAGYPLAVAVHVDAPFQNLYGAASEPIIGTWAGYTIFDHVVTAIGYSPAGLEIQNSWGAGWGHHGRAILTWSYLQQVNAAIAVAAPVLSIKHPARFPLKRWLGWTHNHHQKAIPAYHKHRLIRVARAWWTHSRQYRGVVRKTYFPRTRRRSHAFYAWRWRCGKGWSWPGSGAVKIQHAACLK